MAFTNSGLLIGLKRARSIVEERKSYPMYGLFLTNVDTMYKNFKEVLQQTRFAEINWHAEVEKSKSLITRARSCYGKYRDLVMEQLPGAGLVDWEDSSSTPSEIEVAIEKCIGVIEKHSDVLPFATPALQELHGIADEIDVELENDRQYSRLYHQEVVKKDAMFGTALALFYRVRRFIRRDLGSDSPEYSQLKDRSIASAKEDPIPPVDPSTPIDPNKPADAKAK